MSRRLRKRPVRVGSRPATDRSPSTPAIHRVAEIDALRGFALCLMFVYHFAFDLRFYGVTGADFENDPFWLGLRALIVGLFMTLVGISLVLANRGPMTSAHYWRRIGTIAACALAVSAGSAIVFPRTFIYFGILHCIAVASILAAPLLRMPSVALIAGVAIIVAGFTLSHPVFDARPLSWVGFGTAKPATEDYVPLAPWAGFVGVGIALGHALIRNRVGALAPIGAAPAALKWLGRHSLAVYMVHQPILLGMLWVPFGR